MLHRTGLAAALLACCLLPALARADGGSAREPGWRGVQRLALALPALRAVPDPVNGGRVVDAWGREVLLRGVNVNSLVEYWAHDPALFTTYPLTSGDIDLMASIGWNVVRLLMSWSRVEPMPGVYDEAYLDQVEAIVHRLAARGIYSILDLHQDAWGATLAGAPGLPCPNGPAFGWDGAPGWATFDQGMSRCLTGPTRETTPAVIFSFLSFWNDVPGPGDVGIRTRYARMLGHVARRFARLDAVAGYDVMNEPNALHLIEGELEAMSALYADALVEIRAGEAAVGAASRLFVFEPSVVWADFGTGEPPDFPHDDQMLYAPHLYQGGIGLPGESTRDAFERARSDAALFGGVPVLSGEWGSGPDRASDPDDDYFAAHQALQDEYRFGATLWTFREACGDPHKAADFRAGRVAQVWGLYEVDCTTNQTTGLRDDLIDALARPYVRAAPGRLLSLTSDPDTGALQASGADARRQGLLVVFLPEDDGGPAAPRVRVRGIRRHQLVPAPHGGRLLVGWARGGAWSVEVEPRAPCRHARHSQSKHCAKSASLR